MGKQFYPAKPKGSEFKPGRSAKTPKSREIPQVRCPNRDCNMLTSARRNNCTICGEPLDREKLSPPGDASPPKGGSASS